MGGWGNLLGRGESQCQGLRPGAGLRLLSWRELGSCRECFLTVERKEHFVCVMEGSGSGLEEALLRTCSPWGLPGILSEEAVLMVFFSSFFLFPFAPLLFNYPLACSFPFASSSFFETAFLGAQAGLELPISQPPSAG